MLKKKVAPLTEGSFIKLLVSGSVRKETCNTVSHKARPLRPLPECSVILLLMSHVCLVSKEEAVGDPQGFAMVSTNRKTPREQKKWLSSLTQNINQSRFKRDVAQEGRKEPPTPSAAHRALVTQPESPNSASAGEMTFHPQLPATR